MPYVKEEEKSEAAVTNDQSSLFVSVSGSREDGVTDSSDPGTLMNRLDAKH